MKKRISRNLWKLHTEKKFLVPPPPATTKGDIKKDMCQKDGDTILLLSALCSPRSQYILEAQES